MNGQLAEAINLLGDYLGARDVEALTPEALSGGFGFARADVMVLFGGSILCGGDVLAQAMRDGAAEKYAIVGGEGHTTEALRRRVHAQYPAIETEALPEAEVFARYLWAQHGLRADFLECRSTNCGNNITNLLSLLKENGVSARRMILCQDATMQRRMAAGLQKYAPNCTIINYAAYRARVCEADGQLRFAEDIPGMWDMERYLSLLAGEIPRLRDDADGYGPKGRGYIAHVELPPAVEAAFERLKAPGLLRVREADPRYASED